MKTRIAMINKHLSNKMKVCALFFLFLTLGIPKSNSAQEIVKNTNPIPSNSSALPIPSASTVSPRKSTMEMSKPGAIEDVKVTTDNGKLIVTIVTDRLMAPNQFKVENPPRLVLDFHNAENRVQFTRLPINAASVKRLRVQQHQSLPHMIARVVFDLEDDFVTHDIILEKTYVRIVFHPDPSKPGEKNADQNRRDNARPVDLKPIAVELSTPSIKNSSSKEPVIMAQLSEAPAPHFADPSRKVPMPSISPAEVQSVRVLSRSPVNQISAEPKQKESREQVPLVAALSPASIPAPAKPISSSGSRFSGQPLTLDLVDIPLVDFFRLMAEEGGINIVMDPGIKGSITIKVVKVPWDQIFEAALVNNGLDKQVEGSLVRIARKSTLQEEARQQEALKKANLLASDLETRIKRLNYAKASSFVEMLADQKTVRGTIVVDERSNSLIITDIPSSLNKLLQLIESLDTPQPQVEIEARIVSATRDFARDIGIQFGFVQGNLQRVTVGGPNTFGTIGGTRPSATPTSTYAAGNPLTGRGSSESDTSLSAAISTGTSSNNAGNYNVNLPATRAFGGLGISVGNIFDTFLLDAAITAGESKGLAKLISQPKVTAQNNSPAIITQGLRFPVQIVANNTVTVQFQNAALTLTVTPQITYEGNIVLDLKIENNTPDFSRSVNNIPSIRTSESTTRVLVSDGGTTVIGGILIEDEANQEDRVPGLGSLPLLGNLFRRTLVSRSTQEVLFFVTPRIVK